VYILAAIITAVAAIMAAIIGITPKLFESGSGSNNLATATPITISKYDDPSDILSIEYPSGYSVIARELTSDKLVVAFCSQSRQEGGIVVAAGIEKNKIVDDSQIYDEMVKSIINNESPLFKSLMFADNIDTVNTVLMSSEKKENGFLAHVQALINVESEAQKRIYEIYIFSQTKGVAFNSKNTTYGVVLYMIDHDLIEAYRGLIERTFSSFTFSPLKIDEAFNQ